MLPKAKKSYGQNFLVDRSSVRKIIAASEIQKGETVLEVGPGTGVLTQALVDAGARVIAVEADADLIAPLQEKFGNTITLVHADVLSLSPDTYGLKPPFKLVANIPYNITSELLQRFLTTEPRPSRMVLMVQKEVAERLMAKPPDMGLLSVVCQLYAEVRRVAYVPKGAFRPIPKVDSMVVCLDIRSNPPSEIEPIIRLAKIGFSHPRKQLHGNLSGAKIATSDRIKAVLESLGLPTTARAENLTVDHWKKLAAEL